MKGKKTSILLFGIILFVLSGSLFDFGVETQSQTITIVDNSISSKLPESHLDEYTATSFDSSFASYYNITAELKTNNRQIIGHMIINYTNTETIGLTQIVFHLHPIVFDYYGGGITIDEIQVEGNGLNYSTLETIGTIYYVHLNDTLQPTESLLLTIDFTTTIPEIPNRFGYWLEPYESFFLTNWYPVLAVYDEFGWDYSPYSFMGESFYYDMAFYELTLTVPTDYDVACSLPVASEVVGTKKRINFEKVWIRDLAFCASAFFETSTTIWNDIEITSYYYDNDTLAYRGALADDLGQEALEIYTNGFGEYIWDTLAIVSYPGGGGMEYPALVLIDYETYYNESSYSWWEEIIVHEIAHQYFPFMVGTNSYTEPFIDEPFAVWTSIYFLESQGRIADAEEAIDYRYTAYEAYTYDHGDYRLNNTMGYWTGLNDGYPYYHIVYNKGAIVLEMLERYLGTDIFLDCLKGIYQTFVGGNLFFSDFEDVFNEISGLNLDWYFNQWFHTAGLPRLRLDATTTDGYTIDIEITNTDKEWFKLPLLLEIDTPIDDYSEVIWVNGSLTEISITLDNYAEEGTVYLARNKLLLRTIYTAQIKDTIRFVTDDSGFELMIAIPIIFASLGVIKLWRKKRRG